MQVVGYYENLKAEQRRREAFSEGPFVGVCTDGGWRVECEVKGHPCPALPDNSIYGLLRSWKFVKGTQEACAQIVNRLNDMVKENKIVLQEDGWWTTIEVA